MIIKEIQTLLEIKGIHCSDSQLDLLNKYMLYILERNKDINLTAIKDEDEYMIKMIFDSALTLATVDFNNKTVLDIGTGAGYPGTVIATLTKANVTLMDSTRKKLDVISGFKDKEFKTLNARAETYGKSYAETYDIVVARAVAELNVLLEIATPIVKVGGYFLAMKGKEYKRELAKCEIALNELNLVVERIDEHTLPNGDKRFNILFKKLKHTPHGYPRDYSEIKKKPL